MFRFRPTSALVAVILALGTPQAWADDLRFFQLGTGPTAETRFPIGGLIANALSNPPGSRGCDRGGSCGVPGMVAVAKSTDGSAANIEAIRTHRLDAALIHADMAFWAQHGLGPYKGKPVDNLRGIAMVYSESLHLVARKDRGIRSVKDLAGKKVSFGEAESATDAHGRAILAAYGLRDNQVRLSPMRPSAAADALANGGIDAMLVLDGAPVGLIAELARTTALTVLPINGGEAERLRARNPYFSIGEIPGGSYDGIADPVATLDIGVALLTPAEQDPALIKGVTRALWHPSTLKLLAQGNPRGKLVRLSTIGLDRMGIQLHPGAATFYAEAAGPQ